MFLLMSLLAASIDGFICGFIIKSTGIIFKFNDYIKVYVTIFICCLLASYAGKIFYHSAIAFYINILGAFLMLYLSYSSLKSIYDNNNFTNAYTVAISLAADASILCMYLGMSGYSASLVSGISALLHTILMLSGAMFSTTVIRNKFNKHAKVIARIMFLTMAIIKFKSLK